MNRFFVLFTLLTGVVAFTPPVDAQFSLDGMAGMVTESTITISPEFPSPGEVVTASIDDYASGILGGEIKWFVNGVYATGTENSRTIEVLTNELGTPTIIKADIVYGGTTKSITKTVRSQYVDLIIEPQTYTPQLYTGRALPVIGSIVRATAILHEGFTPVDTSNLIYVWKVNGTAIDGGGTLGKFQTNYTVPMGRNHTLTIEIYNRNNELLTRRNINVPVKEVDVRLYEVSPLYGLSYTMRNPHNFVGNSITLRAVPYNLDVRAINSNLFTEWRINDRPRQQGSTDPFTITLERTGSGVTPITFKVRNRESLLQGDETGVMLQF